jgi:hypothetical protein
MAATTTEAAAIGTAPGAVAYPHAATRAGRVARFLVAEGPLVSIVSLYLILWALLSAWAIQADTWLTVLAGREIEAHGIPHHDRLAVISHGRSWIDVQWLAQLVFWWIYRAGGMTFVVVAGMALLAAPMALLMALSRRRGASAAAIVPFAIVSALAVSSFVRTEVIARVLFVLLLTLLVAESRRPSRRWLLAFPLVALWANVHGSAFVGAALVTLLGACEAGSLLRSRRLDGRRALRPAALVVAPWLCLLATPYGLSVIGYYRSTLGNSTLHATQQEWSAPTFLSPVGLTLFPLAAAGLLLVARRRRELTAFELAALGFTLLGALTAARSLPWFGYTSLLLLPPLIDDGVPRATTARRRRLLVGTALACAVVAAGSVLATAATPSTRLARLWPTQATAAVARVLDEDPHARVFASYEFGDWLLFELPAARGRVAFDGRWEILSQHQTRTVVDYLWQTHPALEGPSRGYRLLVLSPLSERPLIRWYRRRGTHVLFRNKRVVVFDRGPSGVAS